MGQANHATRCDAPPHDVPDLVNWECQGLGERRERYGIGSQTQQRLEVVARLVCRCGFRRLGGRLLRRGLLERQLKLPGVSLGLLDRAPLSGAGEGERPADALRAKQERLVGEGDQLDNAIRGGLTAVGLGRVDQRGEDR